jgi:hypothetical protein
LRQNPTVSPTVFCGIEGLVSTIDQALIVGMTVKFSNTNAQRDFDGVRIDQRNFSGFDAAADFFGDLLGAQGIHLSKHEQKLFPALAEHKVTHAHLIQQQTRNALQRPVTSIMAMMAIDALKKIDI